MKLHELLKDLEVAQLTGDPETEVSCVVYDSRKAVPGSLFVAVRGEQLDGARFIEGAVISGAKSVVFEEYDGDRLPDVAYVKVPDARAAMAGIATAFYGHPSEKLRLVGVTGTNGKTTTTYLIKSVLESAGRKTGLLGTIGYIVGDRSLPAPNTTPESVDLQAYLAAMVEAGAECAAIEVSSHAVALKRVAGCRFAVRVFTNFTQDHLDFHHTMEDYYAAKKIFFSTGCGVCVINVDDSKGRDIVADSCGGVITYGIDTDAEVMARNIAFSPEGTKFTLTTPLGSAEVSSRLVGRYNVYNMLAAAGACMALDMKPSSIARGIEGLSGVSGRFERVDAGQEFAVLVDYAHTEDALERAAATAREFTSGRLITVFGCGGDRDRTKRPRMGSVAARLSDVVVVTSDNPRSEDPLAIIAEIEAGISEDGSKVKDVTYFVVTDRAEAIGFAVELAVAGDTVLIAGKGHEDYQIIGGVKHHFDDRETAATAIAGKMRGRRTG